MHAKLGVPDVHGDVLDLAGRADTGIVEVAGDSAGLFALFAALCVICVMTFFVGYNEARI